MSDIKWIPFVGMNLSAANLAAAEKLRKFGFSVACGEFGSEKLTKASLCIYDVLAEKENPNILLITSNSELYGWYRILMTGIGADFKIITGVPNALVLFSQDCPNLFLMSSDALFGKNALKAKAGDDFVWDLIIIDEEHNTSVPDYAAYEKNIPWKTEKLLINTSFPVKHEEHKQALTSLIKSLMQDETLAAEAEDMDFGAGAAKLDADSPVMRYFDSRVYTGEMKRTVVFREYSFDDSVLSGLRRRVDLRTGVPVYNYGGNIFEEYDCEQQKRLYQKNSYTRSDVEDLRQFDKKLDCFLQLIEEIMANDNSRAMVYCCERNTMDYLRKVLTCMYKGEGAVRLAKGDAFRTEDVLRKLRVDDKTTYPRIILGVDGIGAVGEGLDRIDYIINYELPESAVLLERRMTRHGAANEADRKFIVFRDKNKLFDSRVLDKVLFSSLIGGFCSGLPSRNILLDMDCKGDSLCSVIADLKYISGYASEIDNCSELIKKVKCDYAMRGAEGISNAKQLADFSTKLLNKLCSALGIDSSASEDDIRAAADSLSGLCVLDEGGKLVRLSESELSAMADSFSGEGYLSLPFASEAVKGLADAKAAIDELHKGENFHLQIKSRIAELNDCIQYPVLFGIWRYRVREQDSDRSFKEYIKIYNDGF